MNEWDDLKTRFRDGMQSIVAGIIEGAEDDVLAFLEPISTDMMRAVRKQDAAIVKELQGQLEALAEVHRLKAIGGQWAVAEMVLGGVFDVVLGAAGIRSGGVG